MLIATRRSDEVVVVMAWLMIGEVVMMMALECSSDRGTCRSCLCRGDFLLPWSDDSSLFYTLFSDQWRVVLECMNACEDFGARCFHWMVLSRGPFTTTSVRFFGFSQV